jgi:hypothetical protein
MAKGDHYQHMAGECIRLARESSDSYGKALYLEMAQMRLNLADHVRNSEVIESPDLQPQGEPLRAY